MTKTQIRRCSTTKQYWMERIRDYSAFNKELTLFTLDWHLHLINCAIPLEAVKRGICKKRGAPKLNGCLIIKVIGRCLYLPWLIRITVTVGNFNLLLEINGCYDCPIRIELSQGLIHWKYRTLIKLCIYICWSMYLCCNVT